MKGVILSARVNWSRTQIFLCVLLGAGACTLLVYPHVVVEPPSALLEVHAVVNRLREQLPWRAPSVASHPIVPSPLRPNPVPILPPHEDDVRPIAQVELLTEEAQMINRVFPAPKAGDEPWVSLNRRAVQQLRKCLKNTADCVSPNQGKGSSICLVHI